MTKDEALKLALDTLESSRVFVTTCEKIKHPEGTEWYEECITAIQEAFAQPEQEPHSWYSKQEDEWMTHKTRMEHEQLNSYTHKVGKFDLALYTTPPSNSVNSIKSSNTLDAQRKPLTDEEIDKLPWEPHEGNPMTFAEGLRYFARAIEAAHGIKE